MIHVLWMTAVWLLLTGVLTPGNALVGLALAAAVHLLTHRPAAGERRAVWGARRLWRALELALFFVWEVIVSGVNVAVELLRPRMRLQPALVAIPVTGLSPAGVMVVANFITMTPGGFSIYADEEEQLLYVHAMQVGDVDAYRARVEASIVRRVRGVMA